MPFFVTAVAIECGKCKRFQGLENPDKLPLYLLEKKFEDQGWLVAYGDGYCLCPNCYKIHDAGAEAKKISERIKAQVVEKKKIEEVIQSGGAEI